MILSQASVKSARRPGARNAIRKPRPRALRILWITNSFFPKLGGLEIFVEKTVGSLSEFCDVGIITKSHQWFPADKNVAHFTIANPCDEDPDAAWQHIVADLLRIISEFAPDVVHFASARSAIYRAAIPASIRTVATVHGNDLTDAPPGDPGERDLAAVIVESLNTCDQVFAVSEHTASLCRQWGVTAPLAVLIPGCDLDFFMPWPELGEEARAFYQIPANMPLVLTTSRLVPRKGHLNVLRAIRQVPFLIHWIVVGDGPCKKDLMAAAIDMQLSEQVSFLGKVSDDDLLALYNACNIFVLTPEQRFSNGRLDSEGFGLVLHEAGACARPAITSNICGCREAIIDGGTGILVPPDDADALAEALSFLIANPPVAESLGRNALEFVRACGGWSRLARQLVDEYRGMLR
jgi:phosphatidyl-myo-inositol dimannoside synthase